MMTRGPAHRAAGKYRPEAQAVPRSRSDTVFFLRRSRLCPCPELPNGGNPGIAGTVPLTQPMASEDVEAAVVRCRLARWRCLPAALLVLLAATVARPAEAAAPRLLMVYGPPLARPVLLTEWAQNGTVLGALLDADQVDGALSRLAVRPYLDLALRWGTAWDAHVRAGKPLAELRPEQANQRGRLFPATAGGAALILLENLGGNAVASPWAVSRLTPAGEAILARHGVTVRGGVASLPLAASSLPEAGAGGMARARVLIRAVAGAGAVLLLGLLRRKPAR